MAREIAALAKYYFAVPMTRPSISQGDA